MKWTVLGFQSPYPGPGGATPGYLLEANGKKILIDCGSGVLSQLAKIMPLYQLDAVILSHLHPDHFSDIFILHNVMTIARQDDLRKTSLPIYTPTEPKHWFTQLHKKSLVNCFSINEGKEIKFADKVSVQFLQTDHAIPCYAMRFYNGERTILYGADSGPKTNWNKMGYNQDLLILEATFLHKHLPQKQVGHLSAKQAGEIAQQMNAKRLLLTHLYPNQDFQEVKREAQVAFSNACFVARTGVTIDLYEEEDE